MTIDENADREPLPRGRRPRISADETARIAIEAFEERGYDATSMDQIATRAGVSRRSLFRYFPTKAALVWHGFGPYLERLDDLLDAADGSREPFDAVQDALLAALPTSASAVSAMRIQLEIVESHPDLWSTGTPSLVTVRDLVYRFLSSRTILGPIEVRVVAEVTVTVAFTGLRYWAATGDAPIESVLRQAFDAVGPRGRRARDASPTADVEEAPPASPRTTRALVFEEFGPPEVLHVGSVPLPSPGDGQVRIAVHAASVNPVDWKLRAGLAKDFPGLSLPHVTGMDAAGVVDAVGAGVEEWRVGDEVFGPTVTGAAAEHALLEAVARKPRGMSWETAAALPSGSETGLRAIEILGLSAGEVLVINGVSGGVGLAAARFALARGARVIGTAGPGRAEALAELGIESVTYGDGMSDRIRALAPSVDKALDVAGNGVLPELVALVGGDTSRVVTLGDPAAGSLGVTYTTGQERRYWEALDLATDLWAEGRFDLPIARSFSLDEGAAAHTASESGHVLGKIVFSIRP
jgi:NADPH:quinone reductase-like Zn-dependent oxidoreductase